MEKDKFGFLKIGISLAIVCMIGFVSCNKPLPEPVPKDIPELNPGATQSIGKKLSSDPDYSLIWAVFEVDGISEQLLDDKNEFTVMAPKNAAIQQLADAFMAPLGISLTLTPQLIKEIPDNPFFSIEDLKSIARYMVIPGRQVLSSGELISDAGFPNLLMPSALTIGSLAPLAPVPVQMSIFPSNQNGFWVNDIPIIEADQKCTNGVIHTPAAVILPGSGTLWSTISEDPDCSLFVSAMEVANQGKDDPEDMSNFINLFNSVLINATVLVPTDDAVKDFLFKVIYGLLLQNEVPPAQAQSQATALSNDPDIFAKLPTISGGAVTAADIYGLLAYHIIVNSDNLQPLSRIYPNNLNPTEVTALKTLVNSSISVHPGIMTSVTLTPAGVTSLKFTGYGNLIPADPYSGTPANAIPAPTGLFATNCVNGVYYKIDQLLLPDNF